MWKSLKRSRYLAIKIKRQRYFGPKMLARKTLETLRSVPTTRSQHQTTRQRAVIDHGPLPLYEMVHKYCGSNAYLPERTAFPFSPDQLFLEVGRSGRLRLGKRLRRAVFYPKTSNYGSQPQDILKEMDMQKPQTRPPSARSS